MMALAASSRARGSDTGAGQIRVLMELHHCLQAFSGIGQETRLMLAELAAMSGIEVGGLIDPQSTLWAARSRQGTGGSTGDLLMQVRLASEIDRLTAGQRRKKTTWEAVVSRYRKSAIAKLANLVHNRQGGDALIPIDATAYGDLVWEKLFAPTLGAELRHRVLTRAFLAIRTGRRAAAQISGLGAWSARIKTAGWDILIAQTPFPYRLFAETRLVVRYHDAIPVFYPHTLSEGELEAKRHLRILLENVRRGAFFVCVSEPVRDDLLRLAPQAEGRVTVVPDIVSPQFRPDPAQAAVINEILRIRACPGAALDPRGDKKIADYSPTDPNQRSTLDSSQFFLVVSTLEPRKNYRLLIDAWAKVRRRVPEAPALVLIANPGWRFADVAAAISQWRGRGLFHLWRVPIEELRLLYSSAKAVVCPSRVEGFDLSGVEAMVCDTPVIASDIAVHRWVYGDAALYFDPFDSDSLARLLEQAATNSKDEGLLGSMRARGLSRGTLYSSEAVAPRWYELLERVHRLPLGLPKEA
jgi:glycosyltransferase involved in cell wall biosynthesis